MREASANASSPVAGDIHARLSVGSAYLTSCAMLGIQLPFFPIFLAERGLGPDAIALALALPMAIRLAAMPVAGVLSDRSGAPRTVLVGLGLAAALGFGLVGVAPGVIAILFAVGLSAIFWSPILPLLEAYAVRLAHIGRVDYGRVRIWGSVSFIAANLAGGFLLDWVPISAVIWLIVGCIFLFALTARALPQLAVVHEHEAKLPMPRPSRILFLGILAAACVQASHALLYGFSSLQWRDSGLDPSTIGILWSLGTGAEIVLFYVGTRIVGRVSALSLIALGGAAALVRFGAYMFDPPVVLIAPLQLLHAFTFGATHLGMMALIVQNTPAHTAGRAQTHTAAVLGAVMALATIVAGPLYLHFGVAAYGVYAALGAFGGLIALAASFQPQSSGPGGETRAPS